MESVKHQSYVLEFDLLLKHHKSLAKTPYATYDYGSKHMHRRYFTIKEIFSSAIFLHYMQQ